MGIYAEPVNLRSLELWPIGGNDILPKGRISSSHSDLHAIRAPRLTEDPLSSSLFVGYLSMK
jgi:hypothetical protein